jgi:replicative DNA helicase
MENFKNINPIRVEKTTIINLDKGKLPPACIEIEEAVIGSMLCFKNSVDEALTIISKPDIFYKDSNKNIFTAIQSLHNAGNPIDLMTVSAELRKLGLLDAVGGDWYLMELSQKMASSAHTEYHCRLVLQKYMARQTILFSSQIIALAYDETTDIFELMSKWQKEFDNVVDFISTGRDTMSFSAALQNLKQEVEMLSANKEEVKLVGVHTGFRRLNKYTGGYRNQELIIVAARPGMGKTAYVLKCAIENCKIGVGVGFISLEMSMQQLTARAVAIDTNFHLKQLLKTGFEHKEYFQTYTSHQERMKGYPLYIDDSGKTDITDVVIKVKIMVRKHGIKVVIIDYLQLMTDRTVKGNREAEISSISRRLKALAKELDIPVIALSQLSRAVETRGSSKRPMLSDLRESGAIEQDADIVQFLYRPEYYKIDMNEDDYNTSMHPLINAGANSEVIFAKYRGGSTDTTLLKWIGDKTKFVDVECKDDMREEPDVYEVKALPCVSPADAFGGSEESKDNGIDF